MDDLTRSEQTVALSHTGRPRSTIRGTGNDDVPAYAGYGLVYGTTQVYVNQLRSLNTLDKKCDRPRAHKIRRLTHEHFHPRRQCTNWAPVDARLFAKRNAQLLADVWTSVQTHPTYSKAKRSRIQRKVVGSVLAKHSTLREKST